MKQKAFYLSLAITFALDRVIKMMWEHSNFTLIPHILGVHGTQNTGMAFGWLSGNPLLLAAFTLLVLGGLFWYLRRHKVSKWEGLGLGLLIGGALGNLFDRLVYGYVIDMLEPLFMPLFIFNVADAGITVGAGILMLCLLFGKEDAKDGAV